jgi:hypothetical protein
MKKTDSSEPENKIKSKRLRELGKASPSGYQGQFHDLIPGVVGFASAPQFITGPYWQAYRYGETSKTETPRPVKGRGVAVACETGREIGDKNKVTRYQDAVKSANRISDLCNQLTPARGSEMSYMHIPNLYKAQEILQFKTCYAMEKIHGTSAHVSWSEGRLSFFSGGENHERFVKLFDVEKLAARFAEKWAGLTTVVIYGEAYGGKCMGMSATYGKELRFIAFEAKIGEVFLAVPQAQEICIGLELEFVPWREIPTELVEIDKMRDLPSEQSARLGMGEHLREGVVLRPPFEVRLNNGERVIAKHKREEFAERQTIPDIDPVKREMTERADAIAEEWVTAMRLSHVLDNIRAQRQIDAPWEMRDTGEVIKTMVEDVCREASGEIAESQAVRKAIGHKAAQIYKAFLASALTPAAAPE